MNMYREWVLNLREAWPARIRWWRADSGEQWRIGYGIAASACIPRKAVRRISYATEDDVQRAIAEQQGAIVLATAPSKVLWLPSQPAVPSANSIPVLIDFLYQIIQQNLP
jgi:hypothetical protein